MGGFESVSGVEDRVPNLGLPVIGGAADDAHVDEMLIVGKLAFPMDSAMGGEQNVCL